MGLLTKLPLHIWCIGHSGLRFLKPQIKIPNLNLWILKTRVLPFEVGKVWIDSADYWDGKMVEPGAKSPFPESAHHAINLKLLQIRNGCDLFNLIEVLCRGFDKCK